MITDKFGITMEILVKYPETRSDGYGLFLNRLMQKLFLNEEIDFTKFSVGSYMRARRKCLVMHPALDERTKKTSDAEARVKKEMS